MKILWVKSGPLHPLNTGGKIRTFNMLKALKERHQITYASLSAPDITAEIKELSKEYAQEAIWFDWRDRPKKGLLFYWDLFMNLFSNLPYALQKYQSKVMKQKIAELDLQKKFDVIICDFLTPAVNFPAKPETPSVLFQHNVESVIWKRRYENSKNFLMKKYFFLQWKKIQRYESEAGRRFSGVITVSKEDSLVFTGEFGYRNILGEVATGVDAQYFTPQEKARKRHSLIFVGSMDWAANQDAISYFYQKAYRLLKRSVPDASLTIVGKDPSAGVLALAKRDSSVQVTGTVPDVRPFIDEAEVYVVPLRIGSGSRLKIFEAMAMKMPVISTRVGAEGLPVTPHENILIADNARAFVRAIKRLFENPLKRKALGEAARDLVENRFSWATITLEFESLLLKVKK